MTSPAAGSIRIPIISDDERFRPEKRYFASATAARNARPSRARRSCPTITRLFFTASQKPGCRVGRSRRGSAGAWARAENQVGVKTVDLDVRLECGRDHPEDREDDDHEDGHKPDDVPCRSAASCGAARDARPPARRRLQRPRSRSPPQSSPCGGHRRRSAPPTITSISSEIAAPRPKSECEYPSMKTYTPMR